MTFNRNY